MLFHKYIDVERALKNQIVTAVKPVFQNLMVYQLTGFVQVSTLNMTKHLFYSYGSIKEIDLKENTVKMMRPYKPAEPPSRLIEHLEKDREFARAGGQKISDATMMSRGITLLEQTGIFNDDI